MASGPITSQQIAEEKVETATNFIFLGSKITEDGGCSHEIKRHLLLGRKTMINLDRILKSRDITLLTKGPLVKAMVFPIVVYWYELNHKEGRVPKNWCFRTVVLEKTLESPLDCKIKPVNPKGNQSWIFIRRTNAEAETPILWPHDAKSQLSGKDSDAGKDWGQEEKGTIEDEMVEWHHQLNGHEFEQTPGDSERQGSLVCCSSQGCKELVMTQRLSSNNLSRSVFTQNQVLPSTFSHLPNAKAPYKLLIRDTLWWSQTCLHNKRASNLQFIIIQQNLVSLNYTSSYHLTLS